MFSEVPDPNSHFVNFQDYVIGGESIIPLFSSPEALRASTRGVDLGRPLYEIERSVIVDLLKHHKIVIFVLDPQTQGELRFTLDDLREAFPAES